jgi:penicillin-binding protein 2
MSAIEPVRPRDPRIPVSPQLALRVTIIGGVAMVMFGVIFFRLWYLQVLSGEQYVAQANANRARHLPIAAPRGEILDREGQPIVTSTTTNAVQIVPSMMPAVIGEQAASYQAEAVKAEAAYRIASGQLKRFEVVHGDHAAHLKGALRRELIELRDAARLPEVQVPALPRWAVKVRSLFDRLGRVIGLSARTIDERVVEGITATPYANVTIKTDAGRGVLTELGERQSEYPGVVQQPVSIRSYPFGEMGAQVLGYVGQVTKTELQKPAFRGVQPGTVVGQEGLEYFYDRYLRGEPGVQRVEVNAAGQPVPSRLTPTPPKAGHSLQVTLDLGLQRAGEKALLEGIEHARASGKPASGGAFTALDPLNGEVLAIGSYPSFNPNKFAKPLTKAEYAELEGTGPAGGRLTDRAANGEYPTGSTFKPITAMAALEAGVITPNEGLGAGKCIYVSTEPFCNAGEAEYGAVGLVDALKVSSDTYFFEVGERANAHGNIIQKMAHELGVGEPTGIDLPNEFPGVVPDRKWLAEQNALESKCQHEHHGQPCYIVGEPGAPWTVGYNMDLAVGQGALLTDPLQMAVAYSTLANAYRNNGVGTVVTPHLGKQIDEPNSGGLVQSLKFPTRKVHLNYEDLSLVMEGIHEAASAAGGTSAEVWAGWDQEEDPVYGKTGTAERAGQVEQSWYMCYVGNAKRPIVIAVTVEQGGFGAETAAPIARLIASQWYGKPKKFIAGSSKTF